MRLFINALLFVLPFAIYLGWLHLKEKNPYLREHWNRRPVVWLGLAGILIGGGFFAITTMRQDMDPTAIYVPAHVRNGVFVPGQMEPRPPQPERPR